MSDILSIRVPAKEKAEWEQAAAAVDESVAEFVRKAVRQRARPAHASPWEKHIGKVDIAPPPPNNANVRLAFSQRRKKRP